MCAAQNLSNGDKYNCNNGNDELTKTKLTKYGPTPFPESEPS